MSSTLAQAICDATATGPDAAPDEYPPGSVEAAWEDEICRRLDAYDRGEIQAIPWEEVKADIRAQRQAHASRRPEYWLGRL